MKFIKVVAFFITFFLNSTILNAQKPKPYNVLFIMVDDLNTQLSIYGNKQVKTPHLEKLAKRGVQFNKAYCQYTWCNPSRASLLSGLKPNKTKVYDLTTPIRNTLPNIVTLPQLFKNNGYFVARVGKIFHYGVPDDIGTNGLDDSLSWNKRVNPKGNDVFDEVNITNLLPNNPIANTLAYLKADGNDDDQTDGKVANEAIKLLQQNQNKSFFIAVGFFRPHAPFVAPKKYFDLYNNVAITLPPFTNNNHIPAIALYHHIPNWGLNLNNQKLATKAYYASVSFIDAQIGKVLNELKRLKLNNNTIVVLISDHGFALGQHGQWLKETLFENTAKVPLIIVKPNGLLNKNCNSPVQLIDIYPTLAELCNLNAPKNLSGLSLNSLLKNPSIKWDKPAYTQINRGNTKGFSVRTNRWRYTEWDNGKLGKELYDETNDPNECVNLANNLKFKNIVYKHSRLLKINFE